MAGVANQTPAQATVTITTFAGTGTAGFSGDGGAATSAQLNQPQGLVADGVGNVYIWDNLNHRIRKVGADGTISTYAGNGSSCSTSGLSNSWSTDSGGLCSSSYPVGFGGGPGGVLFVNNGGWLDEVYPGSKLHVAGNVTGNYNPGDGTDYGVSVAPNSLAGGSGGMYFAEASTTGWPGNNIKLWATGSGVSTVAGMSGTSTCNYYPNVNNAPLTAVGTCIHPQYLTLWGHYLYFFDSSPGWQGPTIWRIDLSEATKKLYRVAGSGSWSDYGANGSTATSDGISHVGPIAIDSNGNLFFGSNNSGSIREVDTSGKMWNITDIGAIQNSYAFDGANNLYVSEPSNNKVVEVTGLDPVTSKGNMVVLGDSVAAGEGINYGFVWNGSSWVQTGPSNPSWTDTTAALGGNFQQCHQSNYAYGRYFSGPYTVYDMACTGATGLQNGALEDGGILDSEQFDTGGHPYPQTNMEGDGLSLDTSQNVPAELGGGWSGIRCTGCDASNPLFDTNNPNVVVLQQGANDVNFGYWINTCYNPLLGDCATTDNTNTLNEQISFAQADLATTLSQLSAWAVSKSKNLTVLVLDYYNPFSSDYTSCDDVNVSFPPDSYPGIGIASDEMTWIVNGLKSLNTAISTDVSNATSTTDPNLTVKLVDLSGSSTGTNFGGTDIMAGHRFCSPDPWAYGPSIDFPLVNGSFVPSYNQSPFHPTPAGQYAIYQAVAAALNS